MAELSKEAGKYRHIIFDVDKTLTESRSEISGEMLLRLKELAELRDVAIMSGATKEQINFQLNGFSKDCTTWILAQNGNQAFFCETKPELLWENKLTNEQIIEIRRHISNIFVRFSVLFVSCDKEDLIQDRGCQISFSIIGHNAPLERKNVFDPDGLRRMHILEQIPLESEMVDVKIGGTTCFDYFGKGRNKGSNLGRLILQNQWKPEECLYVGDQLYKGGNDEDVMKICDVLQVDSRPQTLMAITKLIRYAGKMSGMQKN